MRVDPLASDEQLSPELVLVLPQELRAQAIEALGPPVWLPPRWRSISPPAPESEAAPAERLAPSRSRIVATRILSLALIFVAVTALILGMSALADLLRAGGRPTVLAPKTIERSVDAAQARLLRKVWVVQSGQLEVLRTPGLPSRRERSGPPSGHMPSRVLGPRQTERHRPTAYSLQPRASRTGRQRRLNRTP